MFEGILLVLSAVFLWILLQLGFSMVEDLYAKYRRESRERITRIDGPFKLLLISCIFFGCAGPRKTIVLENMPSTIIIHRGDDVSEEQCWNVIHAGQRTWGCAQRFPAEDKCVISLDWDRGKGTDIHELAHCSGSDEKEARSLTEPE